jgi:hypothetical protein
MHAFDDTLLFASGPIKESIYIIISYFIHITMCFYFGINNQLIVNFINIMKHKNLESRLCCMEVIQCQSFKTKLLHKQLQIINSKLSQILH